MINKTMLGNLDKYQIILASNSPRRKELMSGLGVDYVVRTLPDVDESYPADLAGAAIPEYISREKADAYRSIMQPGELLITADTIVWLDGKVLGKPEGREGAVEMLRSLSGKSHQVFTGVCLTTTEWQKSFTAASDVEFDVLSEEEIRYYVDKYQPMDKAGAYGVQECAGSDAGGVATSAVKNKEAGTYTLNGTKAFITNGGIADTYLVFANTRKSGGIRGLTAFIVPKGTPGFTVGKKEDKMGIRPSNTCELILQDVVIPESNRVGREGEGFRIAMNTLDSARPFVGAVSVGLAQAALDCAVKYAKERKQFGQPIASFQMIQSMIADMAMKVETARLMVLKACWMRDQGLEFSKEAAMAKCYAADVAMQVTTDAVQVMGGYGYSREYPVEKMMRDAKIMQIYEGTNQIQRLVIANKILY